MEVREFSKRERATLDKFREYRYTTQKTYKEIANKLGVGHTSVSRWLNDDPNVSKENVKTIEMFLKKEKFK